jgi:hypothetical protein
MIHPAWFALVLGCLVTMAQFSTCPSHDFSLPTYKWIFFLVGYSLNLLVSLKKRKKKKEKRKTPFAIISTSNLSTMNCALEKRKKRENKKKGGYMRAMGAKSEEKVQVSG